VIVSPAYADVGEIVAIAVGEVFGVGVGVGGGGAGKAVVASAMARPAEMAAA
jgi:hypothetical protein